MSTCTSYSLSMAEASRLAMTRELERRRLEQIRLTVLNNQAEFSKLATRLGNLNLSTQSEQIEQLRQALRTQQTRLAKSKQQLEEQNKTVCEICAALNQLDQASERESGLLNQSIEQGRNALHSIERMTILNVENANELAEAAAIGAELARDQVSIELELSQIENEVRFISTNSQLAPAAMATMICMEENGYSLVQATSEQGLVSYFKHAEQKNIIAVRIAPVQDQTIGWELMAETFHMQGSQCLDEMDEFEAAFEDLELGELARGNLRIYPKDESGLIPERRGRLPKPAEIRQSSPVKSSKRTETQ